MPVRKTEVSWLCGDRIAAIAQIASAVCHSTARSSSHRSILQRRTKKLINAQQWKSDRRFYPRRDSESEVALIKSSSNSLADEQQQEWNLFSTKIRGPLLDISMNGVSFLINEQVEVSETVYLRLSNSKFDSLLDVKAHVIRAAKIDGNRRKVVCQFHQNLDFEEITKFARNTMPTYLV